MESGITQADMDLFKGLALKRKRFRVRGRKIVRFAKSINVTPEAPNAARYLNVGETPEGKPDYSAVVAHPAYGMAFTIKALYGSLGLTRTNAAGRKVTLCNDPGKLLHAGQKYDYRDCVPIRDGDKLSTVATISDVYVKKTILYMVSDLETRNQRDELVLRTTATVAVREGGYGYVD